MRFHCRFQSAVMAVVLSSVYLASPHTNAQAPILSQVSPSTGSAGTIVVITGEDFGVKQGQSSVSFGGLAARVRMWSATKLAVEVPSAIAPGNQDVVITIADEKEDHAGTFVVTRATAAGQVNQTKGAPQQSDPPPAKQPKGAPQPGQKVSAENHPSQVIAVSHAPTGDSSKDPHNAITDPNPSPVAQPSGPSSPGSSDEAAKEPSPSDPSHTEPDPAVPPATPDPISIKPSIAIIGTTITIIGSGFGEDADGKSAVEFGNVSVNVPHNNWSDGKITVDAPDLGAGDASVQVPLSILDGTGKVLATSDGLFTEVAPAWLDKDERPLDVQFVGGYEQGFQSSQSSTSDAFLAVYGRRLFVHDHFGPFFSVRLQTAPQASGTYSVFSVFSNPTGAITASNLNSVGSAVNLSLGTEWQFYKTPHGRTTLSLIAGTGFITPLQSNTISATFTMPPFGTVECTSLQSRLSGVLAGKSYQGIVANTAAGSTSCFSNTLNENNTSNPPVPATKVTLLEYAAPDTPNFFPKYGAGIRIVNRYTGTPALKNCLESSPCERGYLDFTVGQAAAITGGDLKHVVFTIDSIHPMPLPNMHFLYVFGSASMRAYKLPPNLSPLVLQTGTAATAPSASTLVIPLTQPDRDFYRIGIGLRIDQIFKNLVAGSSKSDSSATQSGH